MVEVIHPQKTYDIRKAAPDDSVKIDFSTAKNHLDNLSFSSKECTKIYVALMYLLLGCGTIFRAISVIYE
jgi:hypothetical protein